MVRQSDGRHLVLARHMTGLEDLLGRGNIFLELHDAVMFAEGKVLAANLLEVPRSISATSSSGRLVEVEGADADVARL